MKKIGLLLTVILILLNLAGCKKEEKTDISIAVLKGPTGIGAVSLMEKSEQKEYPEYHFELLSEANDIVAKVVNGEVDIAAIPTNLAANLYAKTKDIEVIALNCLGVLYVLEKGDTVKSVTDLKGRTIYCNGQGANPEYILRYILTQNGIDPDNDVTLCFKDAAEIVTLMASGEIELAMLPIPAATTVSLKNNEINWALDLTEEYDKVKDNDSKLTMGCLVAKKSFIIEHPKALEEFLDRYEESCNWVVNNIEMASELVAGYEITPNAKIAAMAIPMAGITFIRNEEIKEVLEGYLQVLYDANPKSVGGTMPDDGFYYKSK